jgi:hypothetical protein
MVLIMDAQLSIKSLGNNQKHEKSSLHLLHGVLIPNKFGVLSSQFRLFLSTF